MYVEAFTNSGDNLRLCYAAWRPDLAAADPVEACEKIYSELNEPARPGHDVFPSLSAGDVLSVTTPGNLAPASYAVEPTGFARLGRPVQASAAQYNGYREVLGRPPAVRISIDEGIPYLESKPGGLDVEIALIDGHSEEPLVVYTYPQEALDGEEAPDRSPEAEL